MGLGAGTVFWLLLLSLACAQHSKAPDVTQEVQLYGDLAPVKNLTDHEVMPMRRLSFRCVS